MPDARRSLPRTPSGGLPRTRPSAEAAPDLIRGLAAPAIRHGNNATQRDSPDHRDKASSGTVSHRGASRFFITRRKRHDDGNDGTDRSDQGDGGS